MATRKKPVKKRPVKKISEVAEVEVAEVEVAEVKKKRVSAKEFVTVWQDNESSYDVGQHFSRDGVWASSFSCRLRKLGVHLKKMKRRGGGGRKSSLDIDALNELIEEEDEE